MAMETRVGGAEEGKGIKGNGDGNKGDERATATRVAGKGQWQGQQGQS